MNEPSQIFKGVSEAFQRLLLPHLAAIYAPIDEERVNQVGTGVIFRSRKRHLLVSATHVFVGNSGSELPGDKAILVAGGLRQIADLPEPFILQSPLYDLAAIAVDGLDEQCGLPESAIATSGNHPKAISICGYLARDFRRSDAKGVLSPAPYIYSNLSTGVQEGHIGLRYPRNRNRNTKTGQLVTSPIPRGLSGGAMVDTAALAQERVRIVGIFTDMVRDGGTVFGEASPKIAALLTVAHEKLGTGS